ncbi:hypothetical protein M153_1976000584 [Pseudoloma neurophilia]|uniref:Uncharacterized protein n=1 Tax=Pseudoloma neurophilia TaxID=146866 RepID=A0A0R0LYH5_9MICR|nr:hypothetical protein M153_1976000584 [Pseudoloma neurophilia]
MLICFFSAILCFQAEMFQGILGTDSLEKALKKQTRFTMKPLLFTPHLYSNTFYSIFDDYLAKDERLCFDNTDGTPCPGSQVNAWLYDIRQGLKNKVVDERAFLWLIRRFIFYYDNIAVPQTKIAVLNDLVSTLNINANYSAVQLDAHKTLKCFLEFIYYPDVLYVFEQFLSQAANEIYAILAAELAKIRIKSTQCPVVCFPIRFVYAKTIAEILSFFKSFTKCIEQSIITYDTKDTLFYRVVNLYYTVTNETVTTAQNAMFAPVSGPVPPPTLFFKTASPVSGSIPSKPDLSKPVKPSDVPSADHLEPSKPVKPSDLPSADHLEPSKPVKPSDDPSADHSEPSKPVKPSDDSSKPVNPPEDHTDPSKPANPSADSSINGEKPAGFTELVSGMNEDATSTDETEQETEQEEPVNKKIINQGEDDLTDEDLEELLENPQTEQESQAGASQTFVQQFASTSVSDYTKVFASDPLVPIITTGTKIPLKRVINFCSGASKKCSPGSTADLPYSSDSPINPCYPQRRPVLCKEGQFILEQLCNGRTTETTPISRLTPAISRLTPAIIQPVYN